VAAVILGAGILYTLYTPAQSPVSVENLSVTPIIVGGDIDTHGCKGSAGYSWCEPKNICLRTWETPCYSSIEKELQYFMADKYDMPISEITIKTTKRDGDYATGSVKFGKDGIGPGGLWLATKANSTAWTIVWDGNGSFDCVQFKKEYSFPKDVLGNFCD
jgi:hypothetical protein